MNIIDLIQTAGVVGAGGAGFPTHVKLNTTVEYLIINGIECEPLLETDKYYMRKYAKELVEIIDIIGEHLKATKKFIGIKNKNQQEIDQLNEAIHVAGSDLMISKLGNYYPSGDEHILVKEITGKAIQPGDIPLSVGAVVINVGTLLDVMNALIDIPVTRRIVTVTGEVNTPVLVNVPIGTSISDCLTLSNGVKVEDYSVLLGGPVMGKECRKEDVETTYVTKPLGGIVVLPVDNKTIVMKRLPIDHIIRRTESTCIQCRMCTDLCPRYLNGHPIFPHEVMRAIGNHSIDDDALMSALLCTECGVCELYACPMQLSPKTVNQYVKKELASKGIRYVKDPSVTYESHPMMDYRKVQTDRIMGRMELLDYKNIHLDKVINYEPETVKILMNQHIGQPAKALVATGDIVEVNQCIASVDKGALGARIHASIAGRVTVESFYIRIDKV